MRVGILTSSRADFGIYLPLLKKLRDDKFFKLKIIAFGTHLSSFHGETINEIKNNGFKIAHSVTSMLLTDSPDSISTAMGLTTIKFAEFWKTNHGEFDLVFCLGDRYEMYAAVMAGVPFQIPFAHIHGGEKTLGAIDNVFRHSISLASKYHFVSTATYAERIVGLTESKNNIYYVGALSLDNLNRLKLLSIKEFQQKWRIDLSQKTILTTFHPETVDLNKNQNNTNELIKALKGLNNYQILITMPNADSNGSIIRKALAEKFQKMDNVFLIENLGSESYFTAMKFASFLLGNTSSGIIEAASFCKYVINIGNRQEGRIAGKNVINSPVNAKSILTAVLKIENAPALENKNIYFNGGASDKIIHALKSIS